MAASSELIRSPGDLLIAAQPPHFHSRHQHDATPSSQEKRTAPLSLAWLLPPSARLLASCQSNLPRRATLRCGSAYSAWPGWFPGRSSEEKGLVEQARVPVTLQVVSMATSIRSTRSTPASSTATAPDPGDTISSVAVAPTLRVVLHHDNSP